MGSYLGHKRSSDICFLSSSRTGDVIIVQSSYIVPDFLCGCSQERDDHPHFKENDIIFCTSDGNVSLERRSRKCHRVSYVSVDFGLRRGFSKYTGKVKSRHGCRSCIVSHITFGEAGTGNGISKKIPNCFTK